MTPGLRHASSNAFARTLRLPRTRFPQWTDAAQTEGALRDKTCDALYRWQRTHAQGREFVLHDGPPYANGDVHVGHALNKVLKDVVVRYQLSTGRRVHYVPGWDCHGLPIENKALQSVADPSSLTPREIRAAARATAQTAIAAQKAQFRQLGVLADWDDDAGTYRTLDAPYAARELRVLRGMLARGRVRRAFKPVYYSPSSRSALAEAELKYKDDHVSHAAFASFRMLGFEEGEEVRAVAWTTTPWTLSANMALAVNPELRYALVRASGAPTAYLVAESRIAEVARALGTSVDVLRVLPGASLVGQAYAPLFSPLEGAAQEPLHIIAGDFVDADAGTGIVHLAPAHGHEDHKALPGARGDALLCHVGAGGLYTPALADALGRDAAAPLVGLPVLSAGGRRLVDVLRGVDGGRALLKVERHKHRYPYDWKTGEPVIVTATSQWFCDLEGVKERAREAIRDVQFLPAQSRNRLDAFVKGRAEWCISRQRVWGVPIPALTHVPSGDVLLTPESMDHILPILEEHGTEHWWAAPADAFVPPHLLQGTAGEWEKGGDTLDVWFDSGSSWSLLPIREGEPRADVCVEGSDQHRGWFQSLLLTHLGAGEGERAPYGTLLTHGMVLDEKGVKMSKSKGNVLDFRTIVAGGKDKKKEPAYGADALRLWAATVEYGRDVNLGPTAIKQAAEALRKIRNTLRFALGNAASAPASEDVQPEELGLAERYVLHRTWELERTARAGYDAFNFAKVVNAASAYAQGTLSALYFDITKDALYAGAPDSLERRRAVTVCRAALRVLLRVAAPITPFLAEEAWWHLTHPGAPDSSSDASDIDLAGTGRSVFETPWEMCSEGWKDEAAVREMGLLLELRTRVLGLLETARKAKALNGSLEAGLDIRLLGGEDSEVPALLRREEDALKTLFIVSDTTLGDGDAALGAGEAWAFEETVAVDGAEVLIRVRPARGVKCPRCWTYTRAREEDRLCARCEDVLAEAPPPPHAH